jgi:hypothetical protein
LISGSSIATVTPVSNVREIVVVVPRGALEGVITHVAFAGAPVQASVAVPGVFAAEFNSSGYTAAPPLLMVALVAPFAANVKSIPVPVRGRLTGGPGALLNTETVPLRWPSRTGAKTT